MVLYDQNFLLKKALKKLIVNKFPIKKLLIELKCLLIIKIIKFLKIKITWKKREMCKKNKIIKKYFFKSNKNKLKAP
jgi:hypothetical protein